jgi:hypothetical protein
MPNAYCLMPNLAWLPFSTGALAGGVRGGGDEGAGLCASVIAFWR